MVYRNKILIIDEDEDSREIIKRVLVSEGYEVLAAAEGGYGNAVIASHCPDLVILELELPDMDGMDVLNSVREWSSMPVVIVSSRSGEHHKVAAFEAGADDYITKPFYINELAARVKTALRHSRSAEDSIISADGIFRTGDLTIDYGRYRVYICGKDVNLTQNEYRIVSLLGQNAGRVISYGSIITRLWGPNAKQDNQILRVNIANIRRKIEKIPSSPRYIFTETGVGYRMAEGDTFDGKT